MSDNLNTNLSICLVHHAAPPCCSYRAPPKQPRNQDDQDGVPEGQVSFNGIKLTGFN